MTDPIADFLTRIRNALSLQKPSARVPYSKMKEAIARVLLDDGWIGGVTVVGDGAKRELELTFKYDNDGVSAIRELNRVSTPGRRVYVDKHHLPIVLSNLGIAILSTSSGIMTNRQARSKGLGGEVLCEVM